MLTLVHPAAGAHSYRLLSAIALAAALLLAADAVLRSRKARRRPVPTPAAPNHVPPHPQFPPTPPQWYRQAWTDARCELTEGRIETAHERASRLVDASTYVFGASHIYTRWASDLWAAVLTAAAERLRTPETQRTPVDPFDTILRQIADPDSVYESRPPVGAEHVQPTADVKERPTRLD